MRKRPLLLAIAAVAALTALTERVFGLSECVMVDDEFGTVTATQTSIQNGETLFAVCLDCHSIQEGQPHGIGPNLRGVFGQNAARHDDYSYSPFLERSGIAWDFRRLDEWIANPSAMVFGTGMAYSGMSDNGERRDVIAFLWSLSRDRDARSNCQDG